MSSTLGGQVHPENASERGVELWSRFLAVVSCWLGMGNIVGLSGYLIAAVAWDQKLPGPATIGLLLITAGAWLAAAHALWKGRKGSVLWFVLPIVAMTALRAALPETFSLPPFGKSLTEPPPPMTSSAAGEANDDEKTNDDGESDGDEDN